MNEPKNQSSVIGKHYRDKRIVLKDLYKHFSALGRVYLIIWCRKCCYSNPIRLNSTSLLVGQCLTHLCIISVFLLNRNVDSVGSVEQRKRHVGTLITLYVTSATKTNTKQIDVLCVMKNRATRR